MLEQAALEKTKVFLLGAIAALLVVYLARPAPAQASAAEVALAAAKLVPALSTAVSVKAPPAVITLVQNVVQALPLPSGITSFCTAVVFNNTTTPVYPGAISGPGIANVTGAIPFCTDTTVCPSNRVEADASSMALITAGIGVTLRWNFGTGCGT